MQTTTKIDQDKLDRALLVLRCFNNEYKMKVLQAIHDNGGSSTVTELEQKLEWDQSAVSHRIRPLREHGILYGEENGRWTYYHIDYDRIAQIRNALDRFDFEYENRHFNITKDRIKRNILKALESRYIQNIIVLCYSAGVSTDSYYKYNLNKDEDIQTALSVNKMENGLVK